MENEEITKKLKKEGFKHVYFWEDKPGVEYPAHKHQGKVAFYVIEGSIEMVIAGEKFNLSKGDRIDVPVQTEHSAKVGKKGCSFIVGEMIEGDS